MGKLIGSVNKDNYGECLFIEKAKEYFDDNHIIYRNRQIFGREFDICVLIPGKGILVVELKAWREENILRVENNDSIIVRTSDGEISASPQKQAKGYRFSLERFIHRNTGKFPLVFHMVCLPQVTKDFFLAHRLDIVTEEKFTFLKEDLQDNVSFFNKLDQALREVCRWHRDPFDRTVMTDVRRLFETDIETEDIPDSAMGAVLTDSYRQHDYSRFYYIKSNDSLERFAIDEMVSQYLLGCKLYCIFADRSQLLSAAKAIDDGLAQRGLVRNRDNLEIAFTEHPVHSPQISHEADFFTGFHFTMSIAGLSDSEIPSFVIRNGEYSKEQEQLLRQLSLSSYFNADQYFVEHAACDRNIVIRAGAGTGKTYTMISRIGFICYSQNIPLHKMADRIVMITFTNDAADQMREKLKAYFRNCYLITSRTEYLHMISRIDHMQISTIHSYAKQLIAQLGTSFGYGIDVGITSGEFYRRRKISDILDSYIIRKKNEYGDNYTEKLGMPVYAIRDNILDFIEKLHSKSVDVTSIEADDFGSLTEGDSHHKLHELFAAVIPAVEQEYSAELLESNRLHLSSMMSVLNRFICAPESSKRICELKKDMGALQFMFVDEFQDTDDTQIESLLTLAQLLNYRMFLVGDIKQCIYRFRGAQEKAFDQLKVTENPSAWLEFSLQRNYRTDSALLDLFDLSFSNWGAREDALLSYQAETDRLVGTRNYNGYLIPRKNKFFKKISVSGEEMRIPALAEEIRRLRKRIDYEEQHLGLRLSPKERSIAILVRENWQAEMVRTECGRLGISVQTNTGGDLHMSQPALDMMTLVNALVHFDQADYLYNLVNSNFFNLDIPRSNLFEIREKIKAFKWKSKTDEREQTNYLIHYMNLILANTVDKDNKWEYIISSLRTKPILQVMRRLYGILEPWRNYSDEPWKQHYYQLNVDLLFEQLINACNIDRLTINTLREHLYNCIVSQVPVDSRTPASDDTDISIQCITVHKSKGLEYGHVILPFCSFSISTIKKSRLHISTVKHGDRYRIGYSLQIPETGAVVHNDFYDETIERSERSREETRILYVAMTRSIRSFSWIEVAGPQNLSWQNLIETEG